MNDSYQIYQISDVKPIWFTSLFSGYDSGLIALKELELPIEFADCCEWAVPSMAALAAIHYPLQLMTEDCFNRFPQPMTAEELKDYNISDDWNHPMTLDQIKRKSPEWRAKVTRYIDITSNHVDISQAKGLHFATYLRDKCTRIMTWSYPCQSISRCGPQEGMAPGSGTRSALAFEAVRIIKELAAVQTPPDILLMENVPLVHSKENNPYFQMLQKELEKLGYHNYWADLDAKDYGSPQSRKRCFMVSVYGVSTPFEFPKPTGRMNHPSDILLKDVPPEYYLIPPDPGVKSLFTPAQAAMIDEDGNVKRYAEGDDRIDRFEIGQFADISFPKGYNKGPRVHDFCPTLNTTTTQSSFIVKTEKGIRKLTPQEAWRIQGVRDKMFFRVQSLIPDAHTLFHLAGDSIDVVVLMAIFRQLFYPFLLSKQQEKFLAYVD